METPNTWRICPGVISTPQIAPSRRCEYPEFSHSAAECSERSAYNSPDTLFLVSPEGGRYAITTFTPPADGWNPTLADWSGDGNRALFSGSGPGSSTDIIEVDLHTGRQTSFNVDHFNVTPRYSRPGGKAVLLAKSNDTDSPPSLVRVDLAGHPQLTYPIEQFGGKFGSDVLSTRDGTRLVLGNESGGLALMGNDGKSVKLLPVPGQEYCAPTRWWDHDSTIAVAECRDHEFRQMLWRVPIDGTTPTPLTQPNNGQQGEVLGAQSAWKLPRRPRPRSEALPWRRVGAG
jgi:TolB protein